MPVVGFFRSTYYPTNASPHTDHWATAALTGPLFNPDLNDGCGKRRKFPLAVKGAFSPAPFAKSLSD